MRKKKDLRLLFLKLYLILSPNNLIVGVHMSLFSMKKLKFDAINKEIDINILYSSLVEKNHIHSLYYGLTFSYPPFLLTKLFILFL